ncbi:type IA DNA topoisomerase [Pantoea agglomerans]|uniref:type IA DNA topoisomerase n=1 Tax=Enterobacter agglomerans TaxID=549 RepID=UPI000DAEBE34|nr:type IA DNA topoisomerase [Pantoea agglomerans]RAH26345.1 type IA DNA topoisomerase [Pantoea agglomerans]TGX88201.1 type IA DNA topoisomerase [Pantoea agglomerans]
MRLFIAEKKGLGEVIAQALGDGVNRGGYIECGDDVVTWGSGHLLELVTPEQHNPSYAKWNEADLPLKLRPHRYQPIQRTVNQFKTVVELMRKADQIVHAGDPDSEGQLLIDEILTFTGYRKPVKRVLINDLNTEKARRAIANLRDNREFYGLSQSALARSVADQLYGFNMTRGYTLAAQKKGFSGVLSVGRVQTVILGLVVRRYEAFKNHTEAFYYRIDADMRVGDSLFQARFNVPDDAPADDKRRVIDKGYAESIASILTGKEVTVSTARTEDKSTSPPLPFSLLDLQIKMNRENGLSAEDTLAVTQALRDKFKAITYNRSDCRYLSTEQYQDAPKTLLAVCKALKGSFSPDVMAALQSSRKSRAFNDDKVTAHTAIIPTENCPDTSQMSRNELAVYTAIVKQYLCQFMPDKLWQQATVQISAGEHSFTASSRNTVSPGWTSLISESGVIEASAESEDSDSDATFKILSELAQGDRGLCDAVTVTPKKTKPLPLYTIASLLEDLPRVAKYVKDPRIKALLISRDKDTDGENGGIGTPATRGSMFETLQKRGYYTLEKNKLVPTELGISFIQALPAIAYEPDMTALWHEQQLQIEKGELTCDAFLDELESFIAEQIKNIDVSSLTAAAANAAGQPDSKRQRLDVQCPACGKELIVTPKAYSCTGCAFKIWSTLAGKTLTKNQVETLIKNGKSKEIKGFMSVKTGKPFSAFVCLADKDTGKLSFEFAPKQSQSN